MKSTLIWTMTLMMAFLLTLSACGGGGGGGGSSDTGATTGTDGETTETEPDTVSAAVTLSFNDQQSSINFAILGTFSDIDSVTLDVSAGGTAIHTALPFVDVGGGVYEVTPTGLPVDVALDFTAHAYNASAVEIFTGTNSGVILAAGGGNTVSINMDPIDDGNANVLPKITNITRPAYIVVDASATVSFSFAANNDEVLDWLITPEADGGTFDILSDSITMSAAGTNTMNRTYTAPGAAFVGDKIHTIRLTNSQANWVQMQFNTEVVPAPVDDTVVSALFSPVVDSLGGERTTGTSDVTWTITTVDDGSVSTYLWTIQSGLASASFTVDNAATATMTGYDPAESGVIRITITDDDGLTTTVDYQVAVDQFPDNVVTDAP
jgi:hypothetical protein